MTRHNRELITRRGPIRLPAYFPVTTFGDNCPLDRLIQPYLPRLASGVMLSYYYARQMKEPPRLPLLIDSGGFASLKRGAGIRLEGKLAVLELANPEEAGRIHPRDVLDLQEQVADVAFTLDFPIPPGTHRSEAKRRQQYTVENAMWALNNRRRKDLPLFACVQGWDAPSARACARVYASAGFDGVAIGGLVPRAHDPELVLAIVNAVKEEVGDRLVHVFGIGEPSLVSQLFKQGVDSVDSSSYVQLALAGKTWDPDMAVVEEVGTFERLQLALQNLATVTGVSLNLALTATWAAKTRAHVKM
jgi:helicase